MLLKQGSLTLGLLLCLCLLATADRMPSGNEYFDRIGDIVRQINTFRTDSTALGDSVDAFLDLRWIDSSTVVENGHYLEYQDYFCFDDKADILARGGDYDLKDCTRLGMPEWEPAGDAASNAQWMNTVVNAYDLHPFTWSNALALSASRFLEDMQGCSLVPEQIRDDQTVHYYIDSIADYEDHRRISLYPNHYNWHDVEEMVLDLFMDMDDRFQRNQYFLTHNHYTQIGMACDCDPVWGEMCIIELGLGVTPTTPLELNHEFGEWEEQNWIWDEGYRGEDYNDYNGPCRPEMPDFMFCLAWETDFGGEWDRRRNLDSNEEYLPTFRMPNDPTCERNSREGYCGEVKTDGTGLPEPIEFSQVLYAGWRYIDPSDTFTYYDAVDVPMFEALNALRQEPEAYLESYRYGIPAISPYVPTAKNAVLLLSYDKRDNGDFEMFRWNEGLARAARHFVNDHGPCNTYGDKNSNFPDEILKKYYAYDFEDLDYHIVKHHPFGYSEDGLRSDGAGEKMIEYILSQEWMDHSWLHTRSQLEIGIACSCNLEYDQYRSFDHVYEDENIIHEWRERDAVCAILVAKEVEIKDINERIPGYSFFDLDYNEYDDGF